jgi:pyruvate formate lyase activating enzyme
LLQEDFGVIGWQKNSFIDFPGTLSTVLFFRECNLRCPYCHNPDIVLNRLPSVKYSEVLAFLEKRKGIIEGVVLSGGEPTLHVNLPKISATLHNMGLSVKLDTNGLQPDTIQLCKPDYLALDIKTAPDLYSEVGCSMIDVPAKLGKSIDIVRSMGAHAEVRITVGPSLVNEYNIRKITDLLQGVHTVYIQQVETSGHMLDSTYTKQIPFSSEILRGFQKIISQKVEKCVIRGQE